MNQDRQSDYQRYSYDSFDQNPRSFGRRNAQVKPPGLAARMVQLSRSPMFTVGALLAVGVAFGAILFASYPESSSAPENIPVITADTGPIRIAPDQAGGMDIPNEDSTVVAAMNGEAMPEKPPIENLLEQEPAVDKMAVFAREVEQQMSTASDLEKAATGDQAAPSMAAADSQSQPMAGMPPQPGSEALQSPPASPDMMAQAGQQAAVKKIQVETVKIPPSLAEGPVAQTPEMHAAASSPETLEYLRSVLEKKEASAAQDTADKATAAAAAAPSIEPASGAAATPATGAAIKPGKHYVQLASISNESAAPLAWKKLQDGFGGLNGLKYRLQQANIPGKGIFYRIQAGPMSEESARSMCTQIKQQSGSCLVVD